MYQVWTPNSLLAASQPSAHSTAWGSYLLSYFDEFANNPYANPKSVHVFCPRLQLGIQELAIQAGLLKVPHNLCNQN